MLKSEENARLTEVGPDTPCGALLRRYWQPICYAEELEDQRTLAVKMLGEDLVVFRDSTYQYGLLDEHCAHRRASLAYGFVEEDCTLRCPYHGWRYDRSGHVLEQPFEPKGSNFKSKLRQPAYPVQELGGILFGYLGPDPAPLLPRWDVLVRTDGVASLTKSPVLECNWLQAQENSADTTHTYYLHAWSLRQQGIDHPGLPLYSRPFVAYGFREFEWGLLKSFVTESNGVRAAEIGNPLIFPNMLRVIEGYMTETMHWRVPIDDHSTRIFHAAIRLHPDGHDVPKPQYPQLREAPGKRTKDGRYAMNEFFPQDWMAWETQGVVFDRSKEHLGASDRGIAMYRRMLRRNLDAVQRGEEPMAVLRDGADNDCIMIPTMIEEPIETSDAYFEVEPVSW